MFTTVMLAIVAALAWGTALASALRFRATKRRLETLQVAEAFRLPEEQGFEERYEVCVACAGLGAALDDADVECLARGGQKLRLRMVDSKKGPRAGTGFLAHFDEPRVEIREDGGLHIHEGRRPKEAAAGGVPPGVMCTEDKQGRIVCMGCSRPFTEEPGESQPVVIEEPSFEGWKPDLVGWALDEINRPVRPVKYEGGQPQEPGPTQGPTPGELAHSFLGRLNELGAPAPGNVAEIVHQLFSQGHRVTGYQVSADGRGHVRAQVDFGKPGSAPTVFYDLPCLKPGEALKEAAGGGKAESVTKVQGQLAETDDQAEARAKKAVEGLSRAGDPNAESYLEELVKAFKRGYRPPKGPLGLDFPLADYTFTTNGNVANGEVFYLRPEMGEAP